MSQSTHNNLKKNVTGAQCKSDSVPMFFKTDDQLKFEYDDSPTLVTPELTIVTSA